MSDTDSEFEWDNVESDHDEYSDDGDNYTGWEEDDIPPGSGD